MNEPVLCPYCLGPVVAGLYDLSVSDEVASRELFGVLGGVCRDCALFVTDRPTAELYELERGIVLMAILSDRGRAAEARGRRP